MKLGFQLWPQNTTWPAMRDAAQLADRIGIDSVWTWDHFYALSGQEERPNFEAFTILAGFAAVTQRIRFGAIGAQKLQPRRCSKEEIAHFHLRARGAARRPRLPLAPALHLDAPGVLLARMPRLDRKPCHRPD